MELITLLPVRWEQALRVDFSTLRSFKESNYKRVISYLLNSIQSKLVRKRNTHRNFQARKMTSNFNKKVKVKRAVKAIINGRVRPKIYLSSLLNILLILYIIY